LQIFRGYSIIFCEIQFNSAVFQIRMKKEFTLNRIRIFEKKNRKGKYEKGNTIPS